MRRLFLLVLLVGLVVIAAIVLILGAFPPEPHRQQIERVLPNDRFQRAAPNG